LELIHPKSEIIWCSAMDEHPFILSILAERIRSLSRDPSKEGLLLAGHGSDAPEFHELWEQTLGSLARFLGGQFGFRASLYGTLHPDNIAERAKAIGQNQRIIVVPIFLSQGYLTSEAIPSRLNGTFFVYTGETYLPHPLVSKWIEEQVETRLIQS
jgi:sirohydrochlorin cobaltochelatase